MKRNRRIIGFALIVLAIIGMVFWEVKGREKLMLENVIIASQTIPAGTLIESSHLDQAGVLSVNKINKALSWDKLTNVLGKVALQDIVENGQISELYLGENDFYLKYPQSIYVLHPDWIKMCSSSIRRGDWVDIYEGRDFNKLGTYRVAFAKDSNSIEIIDGENESISRPLDRFQGKSLVDYIEIITDISEYKRIREFATNSDIGLLLIQNGGY